MGFDLNRFIGTVDEELMCSICSGVLEEPLQAPDCEHVFCRVCIEKWVLRRPTCPVDRHQLTYDHLTPVPRILRNLISKLKITCDNASFGCQMIVTLDILRDHVIECDYNQKIPVFCEKGCGLLMAKHEIKDHNCVLQLQSSIQSQQQKLDEYLLELAEQKLVIAEQKREIEFLKDFKDAMKVANPEMRAIADQMERNQPMRWNNSR